MNILSQINFQLSQVEKCLQRDLKDGLVTINYYLCEDECKFLDFLSLQEYLTETDIKIFLLLKTINRQCNDIIKTWNVDFTDLPDREFKDGFECIDEANKSYYSSSLVFHAIYLKPDKWEFYHYIEQKKNFVKAYSFRNYQIAHIAQRCATILNYITACYPETGDIDSLYSVDSKVYDEPHLVTSLHDESAFNDKVYKDIKRGIDIDKFDRVHYNKYPLKIYTVNLAYILSISNIEVQNVITQKKEIINTKVFLKEYNSGYLEGQNYFDKNFKVSASVLYGDKANEYLSNISYNYSEAEITDVTTNKGWRYVREFDAMVLTRKRVKTVGFYSGIVDKVETLVKEHPNLFKAIEKEKEFKSKTLEKEVSPTLEIIQNHIEEIDDKGWQYSFKNQHNYDTFTSLLVAYFEQKEYVLPTEIIELKRGCKTRLAKAFGEILRELGDGVLKEKTKYFDIIKTLKYFKDEKDIYKAITR
ncbi:MAG: hypothetical protein BM557_09855 [Flavobacterium sp. MedPE-SWcel]|uniref:hypothetical protein n=1 Tax=uncultured Flavobacterium sp. TaxID=165435 RepID=UPI000919400C|nr:hypothetical protein [uncultured Flavobacterium sp.]OIQ16606.1 MAG: hypothetical protein BM557_09855 [Flavobacterium sp. MedPE-SWcel]